MNSTCVSTQCLREREQNRRRDHQRKPRDVRHVQQFLVNVVHEPGAAEHEEEQQRTQRCQ